MKKYFALIFVFLFSTLCFAADVPEIVAPPEWLTALLTFAAGVPYVGPVLVEVSKWVGVLAAVMTALTVAAQVILGIPELVARWAGATAAAEKIKAFADKVLPWLRYLSIFNQQKKQ